MSCIGRGLATSNSTVMSEGAIQQQVWQQPTEFLQREICQLCISAAAVKMSVVIIANCCYVFTYTNPQTTFSYMCLKHTSNLHFSPCIKQSKSIADVHSFRSDVLYNDIFN